MSLVNLRGSSRTWPSTRRECCLSSPLLSPVYMAGARVMFRYRFSMIARYDTDERTVKSIRFRYSTRRKTGFSRISSELQRGCMPEGMEGQTNAFDTMRCIDNSAFPTEKFDSIFNTSQYQYYCCCYFLHILFLDHGPEALRSFFVVFFFHPLVGGIVVVVLCCVRTVWYRCYRVVLGFFFYLPTASNHPVLTATACKRVGWKPGLVVL